MGPQLRFFHFINHMMCCRHVISGVWNSLTCSTLSYNPCQHLEMRAFHSSNIHWQRLPAEGGKSILCSAGLAGRRRTREQGKGTVRKREEKQIFQNSTDFFIIFKEMFLLSLLLFAIIFIAIILMCYKSSTLPWCSSSWVGALHSCAPSVSWEWDLEVKKKTNKTRHGI